MFQGKSSTTTTTTSRTALASAAGKKEPTEEELIRRYAAALFKRLDKDHSGKLAFSEVGEPAQLLTVAWCHVLLQVVLAASKDESLRKDLKMDFDSWTGLFGALDQDHDGQVTENELFKYMLGRYQSPPVSYWCRYQTANQLLIDAALGLVEQIE